MVMDFETLNYLLNGAAQALVIGVGLGLAVWFNWPHGR